MTKSNAVRQLEVNEIAPATKQNTQPTRKEYAGYVGLDLHKDTVSTSVAKPGRDEAEFQGVIANTPKAIAKLVRKLTTEFDGCLLLFCYEAGPCGYNVYRQIISMGQDCVVIAPSKIPKKPGERIKTDRRDALKLATYLRSGDLTSVWVPDQEQEAMRDLTRARGDMK